MHDKGVMESLITDSISTRQVMNDSLQVGLSPFLSGELVHEASRMTEQAGVMISGHLPAWYFIILFLLLSVVAVSKVIFGDILRGTIRAASRFALMAGMFNDNSLVQRQKDNILYAIYFISFSFFLFILESKHGFYPYGFTDTRLFLLNLAFLILLFYLRILILNITGHLFNEIRLFREYLYQSATINKMMGLFFIPINFLALYSRGAIQNLLFITAIALLIILLIWRIYNGFVFAIKRRVFNFYLFLYLCALEIVPILLIYKWLSSLV